MARTQHSKLLDKVGTSSSPVSEVNTEQLINGADSGIFETLKDAGFEQGDFLPLYTFNPSNNFGASFTSTSYVDDPDLSQQLVVWDDLFPGGVTAQVFGQIRLVPGTDETLSARIQNITDSESIVTATGISSNTTQTVGPTNYTPSTMGSNITLRWEWKTDTGTNSSNIYVPFIVLGVEI